MPETSMIFDCFAMFCHGIVLDCSCMFLLFLVVQISFSGVKEILHIYLQDFQGLLDSIQVVFRVSL